MAKYGFIGCGNMGAALARAAAKVVPGEDILLANRTAAKAEALARELGENVRAVTVTEAAADAQILVLGVKPQNLADLFAEIGGVLAARAAAGETPTLVSMAAGRTIADVRALAACALAQAGAEGAEMAAGRIPVIRIMPNLPAAIGQGMTLYCAEGVGEEELAGFLADFAGSGAFCALPEDKFDAGMAISGCGPAFVFLFIDALAQGGVACGLDAATARNLAEQTLIGSAAQCAADPRTPEELCRAVCSPGGTTIEGVTVLRDADLAATVGAAVNASYQKASRIK